MTETMRASAIILKRQPFRERDSRILAYSREHGLLDLIARGTTRAGSKLAGHIEPLSLVQLMVVPGRRYNYVGGASQTKPFYHLKSDYEKTRVAGRAINELSKIVKPGITDKFLFNQLKDFLLILDSTQPKISLDLMQHIFLLQVLSHLGFRPELYYCTKGQEKIIPRKNFFNISQGGLVCERHATSKNNLTITDECIRILRLAISENLDQLSKLNISKQAEKQAIDIIVQFYEYQR